MFLKKAYDWKQVCLDWSEHLKDHRKLKWVVAWNWVWQGGIIGESGVMSLCQAPHLNVWLSDTSETGQACIITEATWLHLHDKTWPPATDSPGQVKTLIYKTPFIFNFPQLLLMLWAIQHRKSENITSYMENFSTKFQNCMITYSVSCVLWNQEDTRDTERIRYTGALTKDWRKEHNIRKH